MPLFWFLAGALTALASLMVALPWLRTRPRWGALPTVPWQASTAAVALVVALLASSVWLGAPDSRVKPAAVASTAPSGTTGAFGTAAKVFGAATGATGPAGTSMVPGAATAPASPEGKPGAGSMEGAISTLEARLAKGGGTTDDWELLAKSFEFLGRPADAAKARAKQLPTLLQDAKAPAGAPLALTAPLTLTAPPAGSGVAVSGEVTLAASLSSKALPGETLFIIAKSIDSPGAPVAVFRGSVGSWPLKFTLDDSQSMMPGRTLSSVGRVTIEARISQKGQPLPAAGDLQGSSGPINPADHQQLKILIDRVLT